MSGKKFPIRPRNPAPAPTPFITDAEFRLQTRRRSLIRRLQDLIEDARDQEFPRTTEVLAQAIEEARLSTLQDYHEGLLRQAASQKGQFT